MNRSARILITACAALACFPATFAHTPETLDLPIVAQDLQKLRAPGKVDAVLWTRRNVNCTVQVVFPRTSSESFFTRQDSAPAPAIPSIQVWLLRADGTAISHLQRSTPTARPEDKIPVEVLYSFPVSAAHEAAALAISIDGEYYIEQLLPFADQQ